MRHGVRLAGKQMRQVREQTVEQRSNCPSISGKVQGVAMNGDGNTWVTVSSSNQGATCSNTSWISMRHAARWSEVPDVGNIIPQKCYWATSTQGSPHPGKQGHKILNSRSEYNRCSLLRLGTKLGDRDQGTEIGSRRRGKERAETGRDNKKP